LPPSFSFHHNATPSLSLSPSSGLKGVGRYPVPLSSDLEHRHPLLSRVAGSRDRSRAPDTGHRATSSDLEPPLPPPRLHGELHVPRVFRPIFPPRLTSPLCTGASGAAQPLYRPSQLIIDPGTLLSRADSATPLSRRRLNEPHQPPPCPTSPTLRTGAPCPTSPIRPFSHRVLQTAWPQGLSPRAGLRPTVREF
jgi:hypothetical protein